MATTTQKLYSTRWSLYVAIIAIVGHRRSLKRFFKKRNVLVSGMNIVDAGCGSGALTRALWELAQQQGLTELKFFGFDLTPEMLSHFQKWIDKTPVPNIDLHQADLLNLPAYAEASAGKQPNTHHLPPADLVVTAGMLEYIPRDRFVEALKNLRDLLKPDGRLFVFISRTGWHNELLVGKLWHANLYSEAELRNSFQDAGLRIVSLKPFKTWGFVIELHRDNQTIA